MVVDEQMTIALHYRRSAQTLTRVERKKLHHWLITQYKITLLPSSVYNRFSLARPEFACVISRKTKVNHRVDFEAPVSGIDGRSITCGYCHRLWRNTTR